jgi:hypothetical protein
MQKTHFLLRCFFRDDYSTSCGSSGTGETPQTPKATRRLTARPAESEAPRDRQKPPVPVMKTLRSFPLWNGNQQTHLENINFNLYSIKILTYISKKQNTARLCISQSKNYLNFIGKA